MKKTAIALFLLPLILSCNGQKTNKASGYYGTVKKIIQYTCPTKKYGEIPKDTTDYESKVISTYDRSGNLMEENALHQYRSSITQFVTQYSGSGKNRTFTQQFLSGSEDTTVKTYKYVYSDDYHYTVVSDQKNSGSNFTMEYFLDNDFRTIKSVGKRGDTIYMLDVFEYKVKNNKLIEKTLKRTIEEGEKDRVIHVVTVPQEYDQYGNPTLVYIYDNEDKKRVSKLGFTIYEYYDTDKKVK